MKVAPGGPRRPTRGKGNPVPTNLKMTVVPASYMAKELSTKHTNYTLPHSVGVVRRVFQGGLQRLEVRTACPFVQEPDMVLYLKTRLGFELRGLGPGLCRAMNRVGRKMGLSELWCLLPMMSFAILRRWIDRLIAMNVGGSRAIRGFSVSVFAKFLQLKCRARTATGAGRTAEFELLLLAWSAVPQQ